MLSLSTRGWCQLWRMLKFRNDAPAFFCVCDATEVSLRHYVPPAVQPNQAKGVAIVVCGFVLIDNLFSIPCL
jgi:hypothetical protein